VKKIPWIAIGWAAIILYLVATKHGHASSQQGPSDD
jgi:hypothetical protein